ncbi:MAG: glycosyltransferase family 2 protein [Burkholderiales bacterium]|nr:glycosyltransferase family 2 protein [Burkholderiales bacterium]
MNGIELVMIVRDEERCLGRCLASVRPWVDAIVVLDTGSVDASVEIARRHGARVARFEWSDDFAAARNAALAASDARWRLVLDADEWIVEGGESLAALRTQPPDFIGQVRVASLFDAAGGGVEEAPSWLPRVLPRGVSYAGRIHEQPESTLPRRRLPLLIGHDGYLDAQKAAKAGRNARLLELALQAEPEDGYLRYQYGKDLELRARFAAAAPHYLQALDRCDLRAGWRHDLVLRTLFTLKKLGRFEEAMALAEAEMPRWPGSPDFFFTLGDLLLDWAAARPEHGATLLPMIESSWLRAIEIGEQPQLQDTVRGRGSFLAAHNLAVLHRTLGAEAEAERWRGREAAFRNAGAPTPHAMASPPPRPGA